MDSLSTDILSHIKSFVGEDYIYFAPVSKQWKLAWGRDPPVTRMVTEFTTVSQVWMIVHTSRDNIIQGSHNSILSFIKRHTLDYWIQNIMEWKQALIILINSNVVYSIKRIEYLSDL